jgi:HK97 family phage prohead protease
MNKKIVRTTPFNQCGMRLREEEDGKESRIVEGHAVVFGVRSVNLVPWSSWREVYEIMEPGCITPELISNSDVVLPAFHDNSKILGRSVNGKGTLKLTIDSTGLHQSCEWPKTNTADELLVSLQRGDIAGMSFAFEADEDDSENGVSYERLEEKTAEGKEVWLRHVKRVTALYDVTVAGHPAYPQTDIARREIDEFLDSKIGNKPASDNREAEEQAKADQEAKEREEREAAERAEQEQKEREAVAVASARRAKVNLMDMNDFIL